MADAVQAFGAASVMSSALLAETIGVPIRTALTLLDEITDLGLLQEITGRRTARIWAEPSLGGRHAVGRGAQDGAQPQPGSETGFGAGDGASLR